MDAILEFQTLGMIRYFLFWALTGLGPQLFSAFLRLHGNHPHCAVSVSREGQQGAVVRHLAFGQKDLITSQLGPLVTVILPGGWN